MKKSKMLEYMIRGRVFTPKRMWNFFLNYYAFATKSDRAYGYPPIVMIEPTNICNLKCPICPTGNGSLAVPRGFLDFNHFKAMIDEMGDYLLNVTLWNWGEPFLNKDIFRIIEYAKQKHIFLRVSTNGHFLSKPEDLTRLVNSGVDELIFSVDGATPETYAKYRVGGNFDTVVANLRAVVAEKKRLKKKTPYVELQFIAMAQNEHEIPIIQKLAEEIGVDQLKLKTVNLEMEVKGEKEKMKDFLPVNEILSRYDKKELKKKAPVKNECQRAYLSSVINWDGTISACCYDPNRVYKLGNANGEGGFKAAWNSPAYRGLRRVINTDKQKINMCKDCPGKLMGLEVSS